MVDGEPGFFKELSSVAIRGQRLLREVQGFVGAGFGELMVVLRQGRVDLFEQESAISDGVEATDVFAKSQKRLAQPVHRDDRRWPSVRGRGAMRLPR